MEKHVCASENNISVVIVTCNRQEMLEKCLVSVCNSIDRILEIIVVNNGGKLNLPNEFSFRRIPLILIENKDNVGVSAGRELGYSVARGQYVYMVDDDAEVYCSESFSALITDLFKDTYCGAVATEVFNVDDGSYMLGDRGRENHVFFFAGTSVILCKDRIRAPLYCGINLKYGHEDLLLSLRIHAESMKILFCDDIKVRHYRSFQGRNDFKNIRLECAINKYAILRSFFPDSFYRDLQQCLKCRLRSLQADEKILEAECRAAAFSLMLSRYKLTEAHTKALVMEYGEGIIYTVSHTAENYDYDYAGIQHIAYQIIKTLPKFSGVLVIETGGVPEFVGKAFKYSAEAEGMETILTIREQRISLDNLSESPPSLLREWAERDEFISCAGFYLSIFSQQYFDVMENIDENYCLKLREYYIDSVYKKIFAGKSWLALCFPQVEDFNAISDYIEIINPSNILSCERLLKTLNAGGNVRIKGDNTNLVFNIISDSAIVDKGNNIPEGEVYMAVEKNTVNGVIEITTPLKRFGKEITDIKLEFKEGKLVKHTSSNRELFEKLVLVDDGAYFIGEFGIGINIGLKKIYEQIAFDEKKSGTIHIALGRSIYPFTINESQVHIDLLHDVSGQVEFNGNVIIENGHIREEFVE